MKFVSIITTFFLFVSFAQADGTPNSSGKTHAELEAFNDRYNEIASNYDLEGFKALYTDSAVWIAPEKPPAPVSQAGVGQFQFLSKNKGKLSHTLDQSFMSADGTQAVMIGTSTVSIESLGFGGTATYLLVMQRGNQDDEWKIVADMFNQHANEEPK